jgi:O-antigen ligase
VTPEAFELVAAAIIATGVLAAAFLAPPAWAVSGALVLTLFQNHWEALGVSFGVDRYVTLLVIGAVLAREWRHRDGRLATRPVDWLLAVTLIYAATSAWVVGELATKDGRFELLDRFGLIPFLLFFIAPLVYRTEAARRVLLGTLVGIGAYLGVTAVLETTGPDALIFPSYIADPAQGIHQDRARGPFLDAGANGVAMFMCAVGAAIAFVKWRSPRWRAIALLVAGLCLLGVLFTLTRAVWLGALVAAPLGLAVARETRRFLVPGALAGLALVLGAFAAVPGLQDRAEKRRTDKQPVWDRQNSNAAAVRMIEDRPLLGYGLARFKKDSPPYYRQSKDYPLGAFGNLHNVYLANAVALGLIGFALWVTALATALGGAIVRRGPPELFPWKVGLIAVTVCVMVEWATAPARYVLPTLLLWTWAGVAWGPRESEEGAAVDDREAARELQRA